MAVSKTRLFGVGTIVLLAAVGWAGAKPLSAYLAAYSSLGSNPRGHLGELGLGLSVFGFVVLAGVTTFAFGHLAEKVRGKFILVASIAVVAVTSAIAATVQSQIALVVVVAIIWMAGTVAYVIALGMIVLEWPGTSGARAIAFLLCVLSIGPTLVWTIFISASLFAPIAGFLGLLRS
jgi:MFS family permease